MIITSRNKIRLSRHLRAQTTPYPEARRWFKAGLFTLVIVLLGGIYAVARPAITPEASVPKEILGQQATSDGTVEMETYQVKKGDTLFNLSQKYSISWQTLAGLNNLEAPYILRVGQKLKIPSG